MDRDIASTKAPDSFVSLKQHLQVKTEPLSNIKNRATLSSNFSFLKTMALFDRQLLAVCINF